MFVRESMEVVVHVYRSIYVYINVYISICLSNCLSIYPSVAVGSMPRYKVGVDPSIGCLRWSL